jgi:uncharacterized Zn finger protein
MRNKLPCSAQTLSQIQPEMIQSVVGPQVFQLGKEYHSANCVEIIEADEDQILSEVTGPFGLYEQTIQLKGGHLLTKCSCTSNEQPFCRHCVAVLLGYPHPGTVVDSAPSVQSSPPEAVTDEDVVTSPLSVNLHHISALIDWLQRATRALDRGHALPEAPPLDLGDDMGWIRAIQKLHARWRASEEKHMAAEAELLNRAGHLETLRKELEAMPREASQAQTICEGMQHTVANSRKILNKLGDMAKERDQIEEQLKSTADELLQQGMELDALLVSLKEVSSAIQSVGGSAVH